MSSAAPATFTPSTGQRNRVVSGFRMLWEGTRTYFEANHWNETIDAGWKAREQVLNQGPGGASRVVFIHGRVPPTGQGPYPAGTIEQPRIAQARSSLASGAYVDNPRPLRQWSRLCTLSVWGVDADQLDDDTAQSDATEELFERVVQAVHNAIYVDPDNEVETPAGLADVKWTDVIWNVVSPNYGYGRELLAYFVHKGPIYDQAIGLARPSPAPLAVNLT